MAAKFWIGGTGNWDNTNDASWSTSSGGANNTTHPVAGDNVTFDGSSGGGTVTIAADLAMSSLTMTAFTGTIDNSVNNNNITVSGGFTNTAAGAGTNALKMGSGTWTIGTTWDCTNATCTLTAGTSTLKSQSPAARTGSGVFSLGAGKTYATVLISATNANGVPTSIRTNATITTLSVDAGAGVLFGATTTTTITNALSLVGTSSSPIMFGSEVGGTAAIVSVANGSTIDWGVIDRVTISGNALNCTNSFDMKGNNLNGGSLSAPTGGSGSSGVIGS